MKRARKTGLKYSKNGCVQCKEHHMKCDEAKPKCRYCTRKFFDCDYNIISSNVVRFKNYSFDSRTVNKQLIHWSIINDIFEKPIIKDIIDNNNESIDDNNKQQPYETFPERLKDFDFNFHGFGNEDYARPNVRVSILNDANYIASIDPLNNLISTPMLPIESLLLSDEFKKFIYTLYISLSQFEVEFTRNKIIPIIILNNIGIFLKNYYNSLQKTKLSNIYENYICSPTNSMIYDWIKEDVTINEDNLYSLLTFLLFRFTSTIYSETKNFSKLGENCDAKTSIWRQQLQFINNLIISHNVFKSNTFNSLLFYLININSNLGLISDYGSTQVKNHISMISKFINVKTMDCYYYPNLSALLRISRGIEDVYLRDKVNLYGINILIYYYTMDNNAQLNLKLTRKGSNILKELDKNLEIYDLLNDEHSLFFKIQTIVIKLYVNVFFKKDNLQTTALLNEYKKLVLDIPYLPIYFTQVLYQLSIFAVMFNDSKILNLNLGFMVNFRKKVGNMSIGLSNAGFAVERIFTFKKCLIEGNLDDLKNYYSCDVLIT